MDRRKLLATAGMGVASTLAGCFSSSGDEGDETATATDTATPTATPNSQYPSKIVDPCENGEKLHELSDLNKLGVDESNPHYFMRPDGEQDMARLGRNGATWEDGYEADLTEDIGLVYAVNQAETLRFEGHASADKGGFFRVEESTDGGDTWNKKVLLQEVYDDEEPNDEGEGNAWISSKFRVEDFSEGASLVRIAFIGEEVHWSPQVGHLVLEGRE